MVACFSLIWLLHASLSPQPVDHFISRFICLRVPPPIRDYVPSYLCAVRRGSGASPWCPTLPLHCMSFLIIIAVASIVLIHMAEGSRPRAACHGKGLQSPRRRACCDGRQACRGNAWLWITAPLRPPTNVTLASSPLLACWAPATGSAAWQQLAPSPACRRRAAHFASVGFKAAGRGQRATVRRVNSAAPLPLARPAARPATMGNLQSAHGEGLSKAELERMERRWAAAGGKRGRRRHRRCSPPPLWLWRWRHPHTPSTRMLA